MDNDLDFEFLINRKIILSSIINFQN